MAFPMATRPGDGQCRADCDRILWLERRMVLPQFRAARQTVAPSRVAGFWREQRGAGAREGTCEAIGRTSQRCGCREGASNSRRRGAARCCGGGKVGGSAETGATPGDSCRASCERTALGIVCHEKRAYFRWPAAELREHGDALERNGKTRGWSGRERRACFTTSGSI